MTLLFMSMRLGMTKLSTSDIEEILVDWGRSIQQGVDILCERDRTISTTPWGLNDQVSLLEIVETKHADDGAALQIYSVAYVSWWLLSAKKGRRLGWDQSGDGRFAVVS